MLKALKETARFNAVGTDGKPYVVIDWSERIEVGTLESGGPKYDWVPRKLTLENGMHVNDLGDGKYQVIRTNLVLTRKPT